MMARSRANVVSSFTIIKGAVIEETYAVFAAWDFDRSKRDNLDRLRADNFIGAISATWLRDVAKVLNRRFDPGGPTGRSLSSPSTASRSMSGSHFYYARGDPRFPRPASTAHLPSPKPSARRWPLSL
jgi:hypothetical protein